MTPTALKVEPAGMVWFGRPRLSGSSSKTSGLPSHTGRLGGAWEFDAGFTEGAGGRGDDLDLGDRVGVEPLVRPGHDVPSRTSPASPRSRSYSMRRSGAVDRRRCRCVQATGLGKLLLFNPPDDRRTGDLRLPKYSYHLARHVNPVADSHGGATPVKT